MTGQIQSGLIPADTTELKALGRAAWAWVLAHPLDADLHVVVEVSDTTLVIRPPESEEDFLQKMIEQSQALLAQAESITAAAK